MIMKNRVLFSAILAFGGLLLPACSAADSDGEEGVESAQQAILIVPCGACTYAQSTKFLDGTINNDSDAAFPLTGMTLKLYDSSGSPLDTIGGLSPSTVYRGNSVSQTVSTQVTSGVDRAELRWMDANNAPVAQNITLTP